MQTIRIRSGVVRFALAFLVLFALYQSAEGIGGHLLGSMAVQGGFLIAFLLAAWLLAGLVLRDSGWKAYALDAANGAARWFMACFGLSVGAKCAALVIGAMVGTYELEFIAPSDPAPFAAALGFAALATFIPSIAEDILTRGLWWRQMGAALSASGFVALSTTIYVLNHIYRLANGPAEWIMLACFGLAYSVALVRSGTLWAAVGLHWGWNLANAVLDLFATVDSSAASPFFSGGTHLVMAVVVVLLTPHINPSRET